MTNLKIVNLKLMPVTITEIKQNNIMTCEYHTEDQQKLRELQRGMW